MIKNLRYSAILMLAIFIFAGVRAQNSVILKNADCTVAAMPLDGNTTIKFRNDSITISHGAHEVSLSNASFSNFEHGICISDFTVQLTSENGDSIKEKDIWVGLQGDNIKDYDAVAQKTNAEGRAIFSNVPTGFYTIVIFDKNGIFTGDELTDIIHGYEDIVNFTAMEKVLNPELISYDIEEQRNGLNTLQLLWERNRVPEYVTEGYTYHIYLDDEYLGETQETNFFIEDLHPGLYVIAMEVESRYGTWSESPTQIEVSIQEPTAVQVVIPETLEYEYYTLNGMKIDSRNLTPGIYLKKTPSGKTTKTVIN